MRGRLTVIILSVITAACAVCLAGFDGTPLAGYGDYGEGEAVRLTYPGRRQIAATYPTGVIARAPTTLSAELSVKFKGDRFYSVVPDYCLERDEGERPQLSPFDSARLLAYACDGAWRSFRMPANVTTPDQVALWLYVYGDPDTIEALGAIAAIRAPREMKGRVSEAVQVLSAAAVARPATQPVLLVAPRVQP